MNINDILDSLSYSEVNRMIKDDEEAFNTEHTHIYSNEYLNLLKARRIKADEENTKKLRRLSDEFPSDNVRF